MLVGSRWAGAFGKGHTFKNITEIGNGTLGEIDEDSETIVSDYFKHFLKMFIMLLG